MSRVTPLALAVPSVTLADWGGESRHALVPGPGRPTGRASLGYRREGAASGWSRLGCVLVLHI